MNKLNPKFKTAHNHGYVFGMKTKENEYVCQRCMDAPVGHRTKATPVGELNGCIIREIEEMIDCTICGCWIDYLLEK